ncbi:hypothetical protein QCA50_013606 [Cerrena zonata]|uniref:Uncharacterized protein n=1 Tax=Cerrena zonata TaxID=2478898 RepID=A0AAW0FW79_9APHY
MSESNSKQPNSTDKIWTMQRLLVSVPGCLKDIRGMKPTGDMLTEFKRFEIKWQDVAKAIKNIMWRSRGLAERVCDAAEDLDGVVSTYTELDQLCVHIEDFQKEIGRCKKRAQDIVDDIRELCITIHDLHKDLVFSAKHRLFDRLWGILSHETTERHVKTKTVLQTMETQVHNPGKIGDPSTNLFSSRENNLNVTGSNSDPSAHDVAERTLLAKAWTAIVADIVVLDDTLTMVLSGQEIMFMDRLKKISKTNRNIDNFAQDIRRAANTQRSLRAS